MDNKTIFERIECQNRIWKSGLYDYLHKSIFSIRFSIASFFIEKYSNNGIVLDVGAGSGALFNYCEKFIKKYCYNDVSSEALKIFESNPLVINKKEKIETMCGNIKNLQPVKKFDVIVALGVAKYVYDADTFISLFLNNLYDNGLMILETTEECNAFEYYCDKLPPPIHSFKYEILDDFDFGTTKIRTMNVYKK